VNLKSQITEDIKPCVKNTKQNSIASFKPNTCSINNKHEVQNQYLFLTKVKIKYTIKYENLDDRTHF